MALRDFRLLTLEAVDQIRADIVAASVAETTAAVQALLVGDIEPAMQLIFENKADAARVIAAGTGLTGGGDLSLDRTLALSQAVLDSLAKADSALSLSATAKQTMAGGLRVNDPLEVASAAGNAGIDLFGGSRRGRWFQPSFADDMRVGLYPGGVFEEVARFTTLAQGLNHDNALVTRARGDARYKRVDVGEITPPTAADLDAATEGALNRFTTTSVNKPGASNSAGTVLTMGWDADTRMQIAATFFPAADEGKLWLRVDPGAAGWQPWIEVTGGAGASGWVGFNNGAALLYDHAVDGTVAAIETPVFEDGFEYRIVAEQLRATTDANLFLDRRPTDTAAYTFSSLLWTNTVTTAARFSTDVVLTSPMVLKQVHHFVSSTLVGSDTNQAEMFGNLILRGGRRVTPTKVDRARLRMSAGNINLGQVWLFKRPAEGF